MTGREYKLIARRLPFRAEGGNRFKNQDRAPGAGSGSHANKYNKRGCSPSTETNRSLIMIAAGQNLDCFFGDFIDKPVFFVDPP